MLLAAVGKPADTLVVLCHLAGNSAPLGVGERTEERTTILVTLGWAITVVMDLTHVVLILLHHMAWLSVTVSEVAVVAVVIVVMLMLIGAGRVGLRRGVTVVAPDPTSFSNLFARDDDMGLALGNVLEAAASPCVANPSNDSTRATIDKEHANDHGAFEVAFAAAVYHAFAGGIVLGVARLLIITVVTVIVDSVTSVTVRAARRGKVISIVVATATSTATNRRAAAYITTALQVIASCARGSNSVDISSRVVRARSLTVAPSVGSKRD